MAKYLKQFGLEEDESTIVDPVYLPGDESNSTPCSSPEHHFTANSSHTPDPINQLMITQREETVDGNQPAHCSSETQSLTSSLTTAEAFVDWLGWHKDPLRDRNTTILLTSTLSKIAANCQFSLNSQNLHHLRNQATNQLAQHTLFLKFHLMHKISKISNHRQICKTRPI